MSLMSDSFVVSVLCNCHRVDGRSRRDAANLHQEKVQKFLADGYQRHLKLDSSGVRRVGIGCFELLGFAVVGLEANSHCLCHNLI